VLISGLGAGTLGKIFPQGSALLPSRLGIPLRSNVPVDELRRVGLVQPLVPLLALTSASLLVLMHAPERNLSATETVDHHPMAEPSTTNALGGGRQDLQNQGGIDRLSLDLGGFLQGIEIPLRLAHGRRDRTVGIQPERPVHWASAPVLWGM